MRVASIWSDINTLSAGQGVKCDCLLATVGCESSRPNRGARSVSSSKSRPLYGPRFLAPSLIVMACPLPSASVPGVISPVRSSSSEEPSIILASVSPFQYCGMGTDTLYLDPHLSKPILTIMFSYRTPDSDDSPSGGGPRLTRPVDESLSASFSDVKSSSANVSSGPDDVLVWLASSRWSLLMLERLAWLADEESADMTIFPRSGPRITPCSSVTWSKLPSRVCTFAAKDTTRFFLSLLGFCFALPPLPQLPSASCLGGGAGGVGGDRFLISGDVERALPALPASTPSAAPPVPSPGIVP
mmetsp:Transcript_20597/g.46565  ORF Transcript_20597/g.46565 Transcript_20597/m.46565 type:complete len:300 (-) Transcript_20597:86-985(-)